MTGRRTSLHGWRERTEGRTIDASSASDPLVTCLVVLGALVAAAAATYAAGGSKTAWPHAFYVPVIIAAVRFQARGALLVSLAAGLATGPLMPLDVSSGTSQDPENWAARLAFFVVIGQLTAYLSRHSLPSLSEEVGARRLRREIGEAVERGQLRLEYQPIVDLATGALVGAEALVRWDHPERGTTSPDDFIPDAERAGCMSLITSFVIREACEQLTAWRQAELADGRAFRLSVNVSATDVGDEALPALVDDALSGGDVPSEWLHLEITETALVADAGPADGVLRALRALGVRLAIDDFGMGESSLAHLDRYPLDELKVDKLFVQRAGDDGRGRAITSGVVALARAMGLTTVAEGVETPEQAAAVRDLGCDLAQGYLFARPMRPAQLGALLADPRAFRDANATHLAGPLERRAQP